MLLIPLDACAARDDVGNKASRLALARAAGLPVLDGAVVPFDAPLIADELEAELARLGGDRFVVRSSSSVEDRPGATGAGIFRSELNLAHDQVAAAVERVRASAGDEFARAYLEARRIHEPVLVAALIQPHSPAPRFGVARVTAGEFLVEERARGVPEWSTVAARRFPLDENSALASVLRRAVTLVEPPCDVEYARDGENITVLQLRPAAAAPLEAIDVAFAHFPWPGRWELDGEHNPRPLSAAQAGLVEFVEGLGVGSRQRVVAGWLYVERGGSPRNLTPIPLGDLRRRFDDEVFPDCDQRLFRLESFGAPPLEAALEVYAHVYRRYVGELAPSIARARRELEQLLRMNLGETLGDEGALLAGLGGAPLRRDLALWQLAHDQIPLSQYLLQFGAWSPAWDVAVPPDDEDPERVRRSALLWREIGESPQALHDEAASSATAASHEMLGRLDRMARGAFKALLPRVRAALTVGEDDDVLFYRAQRLIRRALLSQAPKLGVSRDEVFDVPLELARQGVFVQHSIVEESRAARVIAERVLPPLEFVDGEPLRPLPAGEVRRGHPTAGRARGRVLIVRDPAQAPATLRPDTILVVPALLPSLAYLIPAARALVTEHGGATSHGATLAREYGVPAVLGVPGATTLADDVELFVDGAAGKIIVI